MQNNSHRYVRDKCLHSFNIVSISTHSYRSFVLFLFLCNPSTGVPWRRTIYIYIYSFVSIWNTIKNEVINVASECSRSLEVAFDALDFNCVCASALARSLHADAVDFETICIAFAGENVTKSKYQNRSYRLRRLALEWVCECVCVAASERTSK